MKRPVGRPKKNIDLKLLENLCQIQCTETEIAAVLGCSIELIETRILENYGMNFPEFYRQKREGGKASLRRQQMKLALSGNVPMNIFLGKNYLGQADKTEVTGNMTHTLYDSQSTEELEEEVHRLEQIIENKPKLIDMPRSIEDAEVIEVDKQA